MRGSIIRKVLVVLIIIAPVFSYSGCKKQPKCGCEGDELFTLTQAYASVYFNAEGTTITATPIDNPYNTYYFCNPGEMISKLKDSKSGDMLMISGHVFWECNFLYQQSNYSYQTSYYKVYNVVVTDIEVDQYGKK
jgi:hypothetical protein